MTSTATRLSTILLMTLTRASTFLPNTLTRLCGSGPCPRSGFALRFIAGKARSHPVWVLALQLCQLPNLQAAEPSVELSPRYQDANGDLVADLPSDPARWRDPRVLIFAYTPVEDPAMYSQVWDEFIHHLETLTGKEVRFFPVQSNAAQIEAKVLETLGVAVVGRRA